MANYKAGKNSVLKINTVVRGMQNARYTTAVSKDDMTNTADGGFGRDIGCTKRATFSGTIVYDADTPLDFDEGDEVALDITNPGCPGLQGTFMVDSMDNPSIDPGKGVKIDVAMTSQGAYTKTGGAA